MILFLWEAFESLPFLVFQYYVSLHNSCKTETSISPNSLSPLVPVMIRTTILLMYIFLKIVLDGIFDNTH